jgi:hypothetical protein
MPMAAARFLTKILGEIWEEKVNSYAGGRGIELDTHTRVMANPNNSFCLKKWYIISEQFSVLPT